jgi:hypothetical protein
MAQTILIQPNRFIASSGKLDSNFRYLRRSYSPDFFLAAGRTMDVSNGGARYVAPSGASQSDGSYNGGFGGSGGVGVKI